MELQEPSYCMLTEKAQGRRNPRPRVGKAIDGAGLLVVAMKAGNAARAKG